MATSMEFLKGSDSDYPWECLVALDKIYKDVVVLEKLKAWSSSECSCRPLQTSDVPSF